MRFVEVREERGTCSSKARVAGTGRRGTSCWLTTACATTPTPLVPTWRERSCWWARHVRKSQHKTKSACTTLPSIIPNAPPVCSMPLLKAAKNSGWIVCLKSSPILIDLAPYLELYIRREAYPKRTGKNVGEWCSDFNSGSRCFD